MFPFRKKNNQAEPKSLHVLAGESKDLESFLRFVEALRLDRIAEVTEQPRGPEPNSCGQGSRGWYNHTIEDFLEASHAWAVDRDVDGAGGAEHAALWHFFAQFLYLGKIYE